MSGTLSLFDDEEEHVAKININEAYAKQYDLNKEKEELAKITPELIAKKEKELEDFTSEDSEVGVLDSDDDEAFFKTVALIAKNDPKLRDEKFTPFSAESNKDEKKQKKKKKKKTKKKKEKGKAKMGEEEGVSEDAPQLEKKARRITVKDYIRETALRDGAEGLLGEEVRPSDFKTHVQEQRELKESFVNAAARREVSEESEDGLFTVRKKDEEELEEEKRAYDEFISADKSEVLRGFWEADGLSKDEQFLRDYVTKELWKEKNFDETPSYADIIAADEEDEKELAEQAQFENEWQEETTFRYEEPGGAQLQRAPKEIKGSVRVDRKKLKRREARRHRREKKLAERKQREEELKRLKNLMKKKIYNQLELMKEYAGVTEDVPFGEDVMDEFDPDRHDAHMAEVFGEEYYDDDDQDFTKPVFDDGLEELEADLQYMEDFEKGSEGSEGDVEESYNEGEEGIGEVQFESGWSKSEKEKEDLESKKKNKKKKGKEIPDDTTAAKGTETASSRLKAAEKNRKVCPRFKSTGFCKYGDKCKYSHEEIPPEDGSQDHAQVAAEKRKLEALMEEYYSLEAEDIIGGDVHCKFSYSQVKPNSYGLTTEQILFSNEKDLNRHVGLRVLAPYRKKDHRAENKKKRERKRKRTFAEGGGRTQLPPQEQAFKHAPKGSKKKKRRS